MAQKNFPGKLGFPGQGDASGQQASAFSSALHPDLPQTHEEAGNGGERLQSSAAPAIAAVAAARDLWLERYAGRIVAGFTILFVVVLVVMMAAGQYPGRSDSIKIVYDVFQVAGDAIACFFCFRMLYLFAQRARYYRHQHFLAVQQKWSSDRLQQARQDVQAANRSNLAWALLATGVLLYTIGQVIWVSYDVRMNSANIPFPGLYDIPFVALYPFLLFGTILLARRNAEAIGRVRLFLDALAVVGAALALSWFFVLGPSIYKLYGTALAKFLTLYFPTGDFLLVAVGSFILFNPYASREQDAIFVRLFWGLSIMAISDSLLAYQILNVDYSTGLLRVILNPLGVMCIGLAAITYPQTLMREQEHLANLREHALAPARYGGQLSSLVRTIAPFILTLFTCTILITAVAPRGGTVLVLASLSALGLIILIVCRQGLTMFENMRLTQQLQSALALSQKELDYTRQEYDIANREAQEKRVLQDGISLLRHAHARIARGDFAIRATIVHGPLMPIAVSFNLMADRLSALKQQVEGYEQLRQEVERLQEVVDRFGKGIPLREEQTQPRKAGTLGLIIFGLQRYQRTQHQQWQSQHQALEAVHTQIRSLQKQVLEQEQHAKLSTHASFEYGYIKNALEPLQQRVELLLKQFSSADLRAPASVRSSSRSLQEREAKQ